MKYTVKEINTTSVKVEYEDGSWADVPIEKGMSKDAISKNCDQWYNPPSPFDKTSDVPLTVKLPFKISDPEPVTPLKTTSGSCITADPFKTLLKILPDTANDTSQSGALNESGGVVRIDGSEKKYLILVRPLFTTRKLSFSNTNSASLAKLNTPRNSFKS